MLTDQGYVFLSKEWDYNCEQTVISLIKTGTECHSSLVIGEKYHSTFRTIYGKVLCHEPRLPEEIELAEYVQSLNETVDPHGLVLFLLVLGVLLKLQDVSRKDYPKQKERMGPAAFARNQYKKLVSKSLIKRGLRSIPPPVAHHVYQPGNFAYIYREGLKHYTEPHFIAFVENKMLDYTSVKEKALGHSILGRQAGQQSKGIKLVMNTSRSNDISTVLYA